MVLQLVLVTSGYSGAQCCCYLIVQGGISGRLEPGVVLEIWPETGFSRVVSYTWGIKK